MTTKLPTRQLGKDGPQIPGLGFGLMGLSSFYGPVGTFEERFEILDAALEAGETNWDSADLYTDSEELLGKWFARTGKRDSIFLATKFSYRFNADGSYYTDSSPEWAKQACDISLKRLGVDTIDLYYCHRVDEKTPIEKTVEAMVELKKAGKIKYLGLSEISAKTLRRAYAVHPIHAVQVEYSPFTLDIEENELLSTCRELGVSVFAYSPLGRGILTGAYKSPDDFPEGDVRKWMPRYSAENFPKNLKVVDAMAELGKEKGATAGQTALAWLLAQGKDVVPIPGTKKVKYLKENLGALGVELSEGEVKKLREVIEGAEIHGERYPEGVPGALFADTPEL